MQLIPQVSFENDPGLKMLHQSTFLKRTRKVIHPENQTLALKLLVDRDTAGVL